MSTDTSGKVTAARLRRDAYLYVRQSALYQVANNTESTARQYDLRGRAVALGWPVTTPTGTGYCRSAPTTTPSSWTRTGCMTRPASTTASSWE